MAVDVFFYTNIDPIAANNLISSLKASRADLFSGKFILNSAREATIVHNEIASEYGFSNARALFLMRLSNKEAAAEVLQAAEVVREQFGREHVLLLLENEKKI